MTDSQPLNTGNFKRLADVFKALSDPRRLLLVGQLATTSTPLRVTELGTCCGVHLSGTSRHLALLRSAGVVRATKVGREVQYTLDVSCLSTLFRQLADQLDACAAAGGVLAPANLQLDEELQP